MSFIDDGGPAYPLQSETDWRGDLHPRSYGMSLRDWFAGQALAGLLACQDESGPVKMFAVSSYNFADAMIAARSKEADE